MYLSQYSTSPKTAPLPKQYPSQYSTLQNSTSLIIPYPWIHLNTVPLSNTPYRVPSTTVPLQISCPSKYSNSPNTVSLQILYLFQYSVPQNTVSLPILCSFF